MVFQSAMAASRMMVLLMCVQCGARRGKSSLFNPSGSMQCNWLSKSKKYSCDYKKLTALPTDIPSDTEILGLSHNQLSDLNFGWQILKKLRILDLSDNLLTTISSGAFTGTLNLEILDVHSNQLTAVASGAFSPLKSLQFLHLQQNQLSTLLHGSTSYFNQNAKLTYLDLSDNAILSIPSNHFTPNPVLSHLNVRSNSITMVETHTFDNNTDLQTIDLYDNDITQEVGGTYKQIFRKQLTYLAQSSPPAGNITKIEDGQLPWRRADCGVCTTKPEDCIDIRALYGISQSAGIDFETNFPTVGEYTVNATVDLRDICKGRCGTCSTIITSRCWDFEQSRCMTPDQLQ